MKALPTRGEIERNLSQYIQSFYRNQLGCQTRKVSCHIVKNQLAVAIENSLTPVEKLLDDSGEDEFTRSLRDRIDQIIKDKLFPQIEDILGVKVNALAIDTTLDNDFTGIVALLSDSPKVRLPQGAVQKSRV